MVNNDEQMKKLHDSLNCFTQLWAQFPQKPWFNMVSVHESEDYMTIAQMKETIDEMDLTNSDPQELEVLNNHIEYLTVEYIVYKLVYS